MNKYYITDDNLTYILRLLKSKNEELYVTKDAHNTDIENLREEIVIIEEDDLTMDGLVDGEFPELSTNDKTILGAINELYKKLQEYENKEDDEGDEGDEGGISTEVLELIEQKVGKLEENIIVLEQKIDELKEDMIILEGDDLTMEGLVDSVFPELTTNDKTILGAINELNAKSFDGKVLEIIEEEVNKVKEDISTLEEDLREEINTLGEDLREEIVILEEDDLTMDGLIENTFPELTTNDKTILGAINELKNELNDKAQNNQAVEIIEEEISKLREEISTLEEDLREEIVVLEGDDLTMDGLIDNSFPELTTENKTILGAINELKNELNDKVQNDQTVEVIEEEISKLREEISTLEEDLREGISTLEEDLREEIVVLEGDDLTMDGLVDGEFPELTTNNKTILGAINELNDKSQNDQVLEVIEEEIHKIKEEMVILEEDSPTKNNEDGE
jgi:DNA repair exonuclease SbcCD ATPase subunit